ncbi:MAG: hypothetical protein ABIG70_01930 [Pseudomonadota bacterium]
MQTAILSHLPQHRIGQNCRSSLQIDPFREYFAMNVLCEWLTRFTTE